MWTPHTRAYLLFASGTLSDLLTSARRPSSRCTSAAADHALHYQGVGIVLQHFYRGGGGGLLGSDGGGGLGAGGE